MEEKNNKIIGLKKIKRNLQLMLGDINAQIEKECETCLHENVTKTDWHDSQILFKCPDCGKYWYEYNDWYKEHHKEDRNCN